MSEWKAVKLKDISEFVSKNDSINHASLDNYISTENMLPNFGGVRKAETLPKTKRIKIFSKGDIIFSNIRTYFKKVWYSTFNGTASSDVIIFRTKDNEILDQMFLYYVLSNPDFTDYTVITSKGAKMPRGDKDAIKSYEFLLPPLAEQKAIAEVLSSLDDKIDLLHRQNKTLEQMAETIFRQWFIEEPDDSWEKGTLGDEFDFTMGQSPSGTSFNENGIGTPMYQGNRDFGFRFPENRVFTTKPKRFAEQFDTLISVRAPVGDQNMAKERCCIGRGLAAFRYKNDNGFYTYTFFKMKSLMNEIKQYNETGTVFGSISKKDFNNMEVIIPPLKEVIKYQKIAKPIDEKIISNCHQIRSLEKLRDMLLPKLMSNAVSINM